MATRPALDAAARSQILAHIKRGVAVSTAFLLYELDDTQRGAYLDKHPKFHIQVRQAVEYYQTVLLDKVEKAADDDWKAATWLLEHHPDQRETFVQPTKQNATVQVVLMYDYNAGREGHTDAGANGKHIIDVPVVKPLLPSPDDT